MSADATMGTETQLPAGSVRGRKTKRAPLNFERFFTTEGVHPFDAVKWERRDAFINGEDGEVVFEQRDVETPASWSMMATTVVASKYFRGTIGEPDRETSVKQLLDRVAGTISRWGREGGYFASGEDAEIFEHELLHILLHQKMAFNSPVWFNVGVEEKPQCSACFINSVDDTMGSILDLAKIEGMLFKYGSGTGTNLSTIRSSKEGLNGGGEASGPVSFMKGFDAFAGVIRSGGKTRRAAKMVILDAEHPDIIDFIGCKANEERKAWALIEAGYDGSFNGEAYGSVFFQNANHTVRVTDDFMQAVVTDGEWSTRSVRDGRVMGTYPARDLMGKLAEAAHVCGDPGMQFHTTINRWHTCKASAPINASNPCSEYMFLDDSACNLASLNLMKLRREDGELDVDAFKKAVDVTITAQEILVSNASYPTPKIERNSIDYRPLGLGYANLGALLMARGLPYDSTEGRAYAAAVTAFMTGQAYAQSVNLARAKGPFAGFDKNRESMMGVMGLHRGHIEMIEGKETVSSELLEAARAAWNFVVEEGARVGIRNAQATVLAPTGTIGFMMDCDTTGIEPDISLVKYKRLVGGGVHEYVNGTVPEALTRLGYSGEKVAEICEWLESEGTIEGAPGILPEHLPVFDCAFQAVGGTRSIHCKGHIRMMGATQPFLSGAISKTVNMPADSTVADIENVYLEAWRQGLKAVAVYRDGCKRTQPLSAGKLHEKRGGEVEKKGEQRSTTPRRRLPDERQALTHKFSIAGHEGYITVGLYDDGSPGEIFITMSKEGSTISGLMDAFATSISMALQYGVPLNVLVEKFSHTRFEPAGVTHHPDIRFAKSVTDYIFRWLKLRFEQRNNVMTPGSSTDSDGNADSEPKGNPVSGSQSNLDNGQTDGRRAANGLPVNGERSGDKQSHDFSEEPTVSQILNQADAPPCHTCGDIMVRNGACYKCRNCGCTSGCS